MMSAVNELSAAHRAALALHALTESDRAWLLGALGVEDRDRLAPLLRELEELGIPREARLLETLARAEPEPPVRERIGLEDLTGAGVRRLAELLADEPPRMVAALVSSRPWTWRAQLLSCLPHQMAREVERLTTELVPAPSLQDVVIAEVWRALRESPAGGAPPATRWETLRRRLPTLGSKR